MSRLHTTGKLIAAILILFISISYSAEAGRGQFRAFKRGVVAADNQNYQKAMDLFSEILATEPNHVDALTQLGVCMITTNQSLDSAVTLFHKALANVPQEDHFSPFGIELQRTIARTYNLNQQPRKALEIFEVLVDSLTEPELKAGIKQEMAQTRNAALLLENPVPLKITNLGDNLNSPYDDHSPLVSLTGNRIFFTSRRPSGQGKELPDGQFPEKVFFSENNRGKWEEPKALNHFFSRSQHTSILSLSPDGNQLFLFKNDRDGQNIYVSTYQDEKWGEPQKLPRPINSRWDETHASLSPDQSTLFFTSNRPGGFGGLDIYMVKKDVYGEWGEPVNLGARINSARNEETPMLHPDGSTLYFASEGHTSMGRYDVFYSQLQADSLWSKAVNLGHPINTPDDDFFFVPTLNKSKAYYASYRFSGSEGRSDIFKVEFDSLFNGTLAVIEGTIKNSKDLSDENIRILVSRESDDKQVGDYRPNPVTGKYLLFLETGHRYSIKKATPDTIAENAVIEVPEELAYNHSEKVVMLQDPRMKPPLSPELPDLNLDTDQLAKISEPKESTNVLNDTTYTVQVLALKHYPEVGLWFFNGLDLASVQAFEGKDGFLRYVTGKFESQEEAEAYQSTIQKKNDLYTDAWIRQWEPLQRISKNNQYVSGN